MWATVVWTDTNVNYSHNKKKTKKNQTRWNDRGETVKECSSSFPSGKKKQSVSSLYIEHDITQLDTVVLSCTRAEWSNSTTNSCSSWYLTVFEVLQNTCITLPSSSLYIYWYQIQVSVSVLPRIGEKILTVVFLGTLIVIVKSHCCSLWQFKELHHSLRIHYLDSHISHTCSVIAVVKTLVPPCWRDSNTTSVTSTGPGRDDWHSEDVKL